MLERRARRLLWWEGKAPAEPHPRPLRWPVVSGIGAALAAAGIVATLLWPPRPLLLWNASPSSPVGLYAVMSSGRIGVGHTVIAWAPAPVRRLAAVRHYLPSNVPLVKRVAAGSGGRVFAAYNAGPARYGASLVSGRQLPAETRAYVAAVAPAMPRRSAIASPPRTAWDREESGGRAST